MYQTFYLYLSGSWKFGDYSIQLAYNLNCYWFPQPTATICFYIFPFPKNELLSHPFETQGRPGRLERKPFTSNNRGTGACTDTYLCYVTVSLGSASSKKPTCQCKRRKRLGFDPWVRDLTTKWQLTPVFLPRESHGQRSLVGDSSWVAKSWTGLSN